MEDLKHVIALLLEDARRLQQVEPNTGTEIRIAQALKALDMPSDIKKETEETITVYGHKVNRQFAFYMLDKFNPTFCRIIEELTLRGMDKKSIEDATTAASSAAVVGVNSLMAIALNQQNQKESRSPAD
ncbi:hypothetical protein [Enterobacter roggenkampii]|uniref:hypothetical protein n=1 Tax=Enterobacter roggenkampii TaxID=1812935 RepID=UPI0038908113